MIHLTINTGHSNFSPRDEVDQKILAWCQDVALETVAANTGQAINLPRMPDYFLTAAAEGSGLIATAWKKLPQEMAVAGTDKMPLVTWGVAVEKDSDSHIWDILLNEAKQFESITGKVSAKKPDRTPWCSVLLLPTIGYDPDSAHWLGDLERCLAWAWIDWISRK